MVDSLETPVPVIGLAVVGPNPRRRQDGRDRHGPGPYTGAVVERLREADGMGAQVRVLPNHVCVVSNPHDEGVMSRDGAVGGHGKVAARGRTR